MKKVIFKYKKPRKFKFLNEMHYILYCEEKPKILWKHYLNKLVKKGCYDIEIRDYDNLSKKYYSTKYMFYDTKHYDYILEEVDR